MFDVHSFLQRELAKPTSPSRRSNKNKSGRAGRRAWNGQRNLSSVGGYSNAVQAIYAPADKELCVVVPMETGWLPDGRPNREPRWGRL